jgi:hypothetical protein
MSGNSFITRNTGDDDEGNIIKEILDALESIM